MKYVNYDQNWYDVLRELIETSVDGKFSFKNSVNKEDKQYWVEATCTVKELQFEEENVFIPMSEQKTGGKKCNQYSQQIGTNNLLE